VRLFAELVEQLYRGPPAAPPAGNARMETQKNRREAWPVYVHVRTSSFTQAMRRDRVNLFSCLLATHWHEHLDSFASGAVSGVLLPSGGAKGAFLLALPILGIWDGTPAFRASMLRT
jgi:hypothetical protein